VGKDELESVSAERAAPLSPATRQPALLITALSPTSEGSRSVMEELESRLSSVGPRPVVIQRGGTALTRAFRMIATTWRRRKLFGFAIVDLFSGRAFLWGEAVCGILRWLRKPHLVVLRGGGLPDFARRHPWWVRRTLGGATIVAAPSVYLLEQMSRYRNGIALLPNALDVGSYPFVPRRHPRARLVWLRAFHRIYNPGLAVRVVASLAQRFPDVRLLMVGRDKGDGSLQKTQRLARELAAEDRVSFVGGVPKASVPNWLSRGDIFLNTTDVDNTPVSVLEAMACGLCIVSTNVGGIPDLLTDGLDALLVPPNNTEAMADAVGRILSEPELAERLSRGGRQKTKALDWSRVLPQWEDLIRTLARQAEGMGRRC
jgi:L-malate glycosyltransferase